MGDLPSQAQFFKDERSRPSAWGRSGALKMVHMGERLRARAFDAVGRGV
jgi:hypothetical protein